jgi:hypothetical protein
MMSKLVKQKSDCQSMINAQAEAMGMLESSYTPKQNLTTIVRILEMLLQYLMVGSVLKRGAQPPSQG